MANVLIEKQTMTDIADAIRNKNRLTETYKPAEMAAAIIAIPAQELIVIGDDCSYAFAYSCWRPELLGNFRTEDITNANRMFYSNVWVDYIPFDINFTSNSQIDCSYMFNGCLRLRAVPTINCNGSTYKALGYFFYKCSDLRSIDEELLKTLYVDESVTTVSVQFPYGAFNQCYILDEVRGLYPPSQTVTSNMFNGTFTDCFRVQDVIFATDNGTPYVRTWSNQTINLAANVGFIKSGYGAEFCIDAESGITADKEVTNDTTYAELKDDPNWFTRKSAYSRYNRDSAVRTINSLPDCSSGSSNTIKFYSGSAVNSLTEEEIAVATAKGWTVSFATS